MKKLLEKYRDMSWLSRGIIGFIFLLPFAFATEIWQASVDVLALPVGTIEEYFFRGTDVSKLDYASFRVDKKSTFETPYIDIYTQFLKEFGGVKLNSTFVSFKSRKNDFSGDTVEVSFKNKESRRHYRISISTVDAHIIGFHSITPWRSNGYTEYFRTSTPIDLAKLNKIKKERPLE